MTTTDMELLRQYVSQQSESAFAALVSRHAGLVYSAALRSVRDPQLAEEITQAAFIILARKAGSLDEKTILAGWLYRTSCYIASSAHKQQQRRQQREQEAYMQSTLQPAQTTAAWEQISPRLEEAMLRLGQADRDALVLRFFEGRNFHEVGAALGASEAAAKKRVARALEKLHRYFNRHGVSSTTAILAGALAANSVQAAPATLAVSVTAAAMAKGAAASGSTLTLIKGALNIMAWTKAKTAMVVGLGVLLAAGTSTITIRQIAHHQESSVWNHITSNDGEQLRSAPPAVSIRSTQYAPSVRGWHTSNGKVLGLGQPFNVLVAIAYNMSASRIILSTPLPQGEYDFIASIPQRQKESLQEAITKNYGLIAQREIHATNVLLLTIKQPSAPGLKPSPERVASKTYSTRFGDGQIQCSNISLAELAAALESYLGEIPVVDKTGTASRFDIEVHWSDSGTIHPSNPEGLKQVLHDQLGLDLVPGRQPIEMLVVAKTK